MMSTTASTLNQAEAAEQAARPPNQQTSASLWACLLVSPEGRLRMRLKQAASEAGWATVECRTPEESVRQAVLHKFPLALIDASEGAAVRDAYDDLLRVLRPMGSNLVVVCDRDANPEGELWSRQRGAWMYLPSVDEQSDLARICREAKSIAEKLQGPELAEADKP